MKYLLRIIILSFVYGRISGNALDSVTGIRLVDGSGPYEGRLELAVSGIWGTICDTNFDMENAEVFCRMLNLSATAYKPRAYYGEGTGPIYADNVRCNGYEPDVSSCRYDFGSTCEHSNDISLICTECGSIKHGIGNISVTADGRTLQLACDNSVSDTESVTCNTDGTWSEQVLYCNQLAYPLPIMDIRLEYGAGIYDGRVEVLLNGTWGTICGNGFSETEAIAICNMLNLTYFEYFPGNYFNAGYYSSGTGPVYIDNLHCTGSEQNINQCKYDIVNECTAYAYPVAVVCKDDKINITDIRLVDGPTPYEGRVEVYWDGVWGTICHRSGHHDDDDGRILCSMLNLNYLYIYDNTHFGYGDEPNLLYFFTCDPNAESINNIDCSLYTPPYKWMCDTRYAMSLTCSECPEPNITNGTIKSLNSSVIVVTCDSGYLPREVTMHCRNETTWFQSEWCTAYEQPNITSVRIAEISGPYYGYPEVEINGTWTRFCYGDKTPHHPAYAICYLFGARVKAYWSSATYTDVESPYVYNFECDNYGAINDCTFNYANITCSKILAVDCWGPPLNITDLRLANGTSEWEGRAEIKVGEVWGTICDTYFGIDDANAFCRMLGLKAVQYFTGSVYGAGSGPTFVDRYYCSSSSSQLLSDCSYIYRNECESNSIVSVMCNECGQTELSHWDVSFFTYNDTTIYADCSYYNTYVGILELTCNNVTQLWETVGECQEYTYPLDITGIRLVNGNGQSKGRVELQSMEYWGTICGDAFGQYEADMICEMIGYWPAVTYYTNASHGEGSGAIFVDDLSCGQDASGFNECTYITDDDCTHADDVSVVCTDCGDPTPLNGFANSTRTNYSTVVEVSCAPGYILEGNSIITCQINSSWSDQPSCRLIDCGDPTPDNGNVNTTQTTNGTAVSVSCDTGYELTGPSVIICQTDNSWTANTACLIQDCGIPSSSNAVVELLNNQTTYSSIATLTCVTGYLPTGSTTVTCLSNGTWEVWPTCEIVDCNDPTPYRGFANSNKTTYGSIVAISCESGLNLTGSSIIECLEDGTWSDTPTCDLSDCGVPQMSNGFVDVNGTVIGSSAIVACNEGYDLNGTDIIECTSAGWNDSSLSCVIQECNDPTPVHGMLVDYTGEGFNYGDTVELACDEGYEIEGDSLISCEDGGVWSNNPECVLKDCGALAPPDNGSIIDNGGTKYRSVVFFYCNEGYLIVGRSELMCNSDGVWDSNPPLCQRLADVGEYCTSNQFCRSLGAVCDQNTCQCRSGVYDLRTYTCDAMPLLPYGLATDTVLQHGGCSESVKFPPGIPIFGNRYKSVQVCHGGFVKFEKLANQTSSPLLLSPYFTSIIEGTISYRAYDILHYDTMLEHSDETEFIEDIVVKYSSMESFDASFVLVATWENVRSDDNNLDSSKGATFQLVLVTDGTYTFTFYIYGNKLMNWVLGSHLINSSHKPKPEIFVGYSFGNKLYKHQYSFKENVLEMDKKARQGDLTGIVFRPLFQQSNLPVDHSTKCIKWYNANRDEEDNMNWISTLLPDCPCDIWLSRWDPWFWNIGLQRTRTDVKHVCVDMLPGRTFEPYGKSCCYDLDTWLWVDEKSVAGNMYRYHQDYPTEHYLHDTQPKELCCSTPYCHLFYKLRPQGVCYDVTPYHFGTFWGDPHFQTLDGLNYTFNGLGEYHLVKLNASNVTFELQARLARATSANGTFIDATIFSAFAARENGNSSFHVELNKAKNGLNWYSNNIDKSKGYAKAAKEGNQFVYRSPDGNQIISRRGTDMNVFFPTSGISFNISVNTEMLSLTLVLPQIFRNQTAGLLGNFNGIPEDDFTLPNGTVMDFTMSEREIFTYGQHWAINSNESILVYEAGKSHDDYHNSSFVPKFLGDVDSESQDAAALKCNGSQNVECILDTLFTGRDDVGEHTLNVKNTAEVTKQHMDERLPTLVGCTAVSVTVGNEVVCHLNISDNAGVTFIANTANATYDPIANQLKYFQETDNPADIRIVAVNANNRSSNIFILNGLICSGCNGRGYCADYKREDDRETEHFKYAACTCDTRYTGVDCESDFNACEELPCSHDRECTPLSAEDQLAKNKTYMCGPCPDGYIGSGNSNEICTDIDECESSKPCEHDCINTAGSYQCNCNNGYRISPTDPHGCLDINECDEYLNNCTQICNNYDGGHNCTCFTGYFFNVTSESCQLDEIEDACSTYGSICANTAGCKVDKDGDPTCFCNPGFELNGTECQDIDECENNACPQSCENTNGSFICSCMAGYKPNELRDCEECDSEHWGYNCENECTCTGQGAEYCDVVKGCVCSAGWQGDTCDDNVNECAVDVNACNDYRKVCVDNPGSYSCVCRDGFVERTDGTCEDLDECDKPVDNECEQICVNTIGNYSCECESGLNVKDQNFCTDIDECKIGQHKCEQICDNYAGSYNCFCYVGYSLNDDRETCTKLKDPCLEVGNLTCQHFCYVTQTHYECRCQDGYELRDDEETCDDVDECTNGQSACSEGATCNNIAGGYVCECQDGSKLDNDGRTCLECDDQHYGPGCEYTCSCLNGACDKLTGCICFAGWQGEHCDIDENECELQGDLCTTEHSVCVNTPGGYKCQCDEGYFNDTGECKDINECNDSSLNTCDQVCTNTEGSYTCKCSSGFMLNGSRCKDIDECEGFNNCDHQCENTLGSYKCYCEDGYRIDPKTRQNCIPLSQCSELQISECGGNASCFIENGLRNCKCIKGFQNVSGSCLDIDECESDVCTQTCENNAGSFQCFCSDGFTLADDMVTCLECEDGRYGSGCLQNCTCNVTNTVSCSEVNGTCLCKDTWQGDSCDEDVNECNITNSCPIHSTCHNLPGEYVCSCNTGYWDTEDGACEACADWTFGENCASNCTCNKTNTVSCNHTTGTCECDIGWKGSDCGIDINECDNSTTCPNHSTCTNTDGGYVCGCDTGYYMTDDDSCQVCVDWTFGENCASNCTCNKTNTVSCDHTTGTCECDIGWKGSDCGTDVDECENTTTCSSEHSTCTNTEGGYLCGCEQGYYMSEDDSCQVCADWTFGENCASNCTCNKTNTVSCNHTTGTCECDIGWKGSDCGTDVDECENTTTCSSEHSTCTNTEGGYVCGCETGYYMTEDDTCQVCSDWTFGKECASNCTCNKTNTVSCNHITGTCECDIGWKGSDCGTDVDECINITTCSSEHSTCTNTDGGYVCSCETGYYITEDNVCNGCSEWTFGEMCTSSCTCNQSTTVSCDHMTGNCSCTDGWTGLNCGDDINECDDYTTCPHDHSYCNNTEGSFECKCEVGYFKHEDTSCHICPEWTYGPQCSSNCSCVKNNTAKCDDSGVCSCVGGWEGSDCEHDIDECDSTSTCPHPHFNCTNTIGGYMCDCEKGYNQTDETTCEVCPDWTYGVGCSLDCDCKEAESCDHVTGNCTCKVGWEGSDCSNDINECNDATVCPGSHARCINTQGWFTCDCDDGYHRGENGICRAMAVKVRNTMTIDIELPPEADLKNRTYSLLLDQKLIAALQAFYSKRIQAELFFHIIDKRFGSLIVNYSVAYAVQDNKIMSDIVSVIGELNDGAVIEFDGKIYNVSSDDITSNDPCEIYKTLIGECEIGYQCVVENGIGICRTKRSDYALKVAIGAAAAAAVVMIIIVVGVTYFLRQLTERRKKRRLYYQRRAASDLNPLGKIQGCGQLTWKSMLTRHPTYLDSDRQYRIPRVRQPPMYDNNSYMRD